MLIFGQNDTNAAVTQLQRLTSALEDRSRALENVDVALSATVGELTRAVQILLARDHQPAPIPVQAPSAPVHAPALTSVSLLPVSHVPAMATSAAAVPPAPAASAVIVTPMPVPAAALAVPAAAAPAVALPDMQARSPLRSLPEDDDLDDGRNVRQHTEPAPVVSTSAAAVPGAPSTSRVPDAPSRRNDTAREIIFGPVKWNSNINAECRTVIAEGMSSRSNMRGFFTRRGPDNLHIIIGFETAGASDWFVHTWMQERSSMWAAVVARPNV
ncbi:hypothetical protein B0H12DRAFT_1325202 [Mycena haematopus]|nr:hypothetical protein B0H12DRAFT_1325202 [Mycena haematopus]